VATWSKNNIGIPLVKPITMAKDTSTHTVKFQPIDQAFSAGAVLGTQGTAQKHIWYPASDLDTEKIYDVYVDGTKVYRILGADIVGNIEL